MCSSSFLPALFFLCITNEFESLRGKADLSTDRRAPTCWRCSASCGKAAALASPRELYTGRRALACLLAGLQIACMSTLVQSACMSAHCQLDCSPPCRCCQEAMLDCCTAVGLPQAQCTHVQAQMLSLGYVPWATNCSAMRYTGAWGCEGDLTFVRPGQFDERLVRQLCVRLGSCGPGTWRDAFKDGIKSGLANRSGRTGTPDVIKPWCPDSSALMDRWGRCPGSVLVNKSKMLAVRSCLAKTPSCECCK
mmetsp:Transcript_72808/g.144681  ORF Transcript_72808/g.144681 Transcript_72808/m.144681 type:complete len:250 (-) Transcript_72808:104-853(-)